MTVADPNARAVVISVVYDGPPRAGKTTSVRALARSFGREVYTPEERDGRTVFFDWMEHLGGRFEGAPIRCQVVSVPGQRRWTRRRGHFLDRADVVVFVGDTTADAWPDTIARLAELRADLDRRGGPPVGLVFQANKRDLPDAVDLAEIKERAASARTAVVESIAEDGTGIREAFVFAVRLALDRVREELELGHQPYCRAGFGDAGPGLVEQLRGFDAAQLLPDDTAVSAAPAPVADLRAPTHDVPSGFVWPPIEGRILLREAATDSAVTVSPAGDFLAGAPAWQIHSRATDVFVNLDEARAALLVWAREHAAAQPFLSRQRCIVLSATGDERWRLWQIVRRVPALGDLVREQALAAETAARLVAEAQARLATEQLALPCTLETVGLTDLTRPVYVGMMPHGIRGGA